MSAVAAHADVKADISDSSATRSKPYGVDATWVSLFWGERATAAVTRTLTTGTSHSGAARTRSYGVDAAIMHLEGHERGIHIV